jgi:hypothetical protein
MVRRLTLATPTDRGGVLQVGADIIGWYDAAIADTRRFVYLAAIMTGSRAAPWGLVAVEHDGGFDAGRYGCPCNERTTPEVLHRLLLGQNKRRRGGKSCRGQVIFVKDQAWARARRPIP